MGVACILEAVQRFKTGGEIGTNSGLIETNPIQVYMAVSTSTL